MLPTITIDGRAVADPDLRFTNGGRGVCNLRIAANDSKKLDDGTWENTEQIFVSAPIWNTESKPNIAEHVAESISKGDRVIVTGKIYQREYESNGEKRISIELKFATVSKVLDPPRASSGGGGWASQQTPPSAPAADPWATTPSSTEEPPF